MTLSYNLVNSILLVVFLYQFKVEKKSTISFKISNPFLFLYVSLLILGFLADGTPWDIQFNFWRASLMQSIILSLIIWNVARTDFKILNYIKYALIVSVIISGIYGLILTQFDGINPYTSFLAKYYSAKDVADIYAPSAARIGFSTAAKIQSTMIHPMSWGLFLCFVFIIFFTIFIKSRNYYLLLLLPLIGINMLVSGTRTGIAALTIGAAYFLIRQKKLKIFIWSLATFIILGLLIQSNDDLSNLFNSFVDIKGTNNNVQGSSISMRLDQFQGVINEMKGNELLGKGYGWSAYYQSIHGDHRTILAFESLIFVVLCNSGILGALIWLFFIYLLFRLQRIYLKNNEDIFLMDSFVIIFIAYAIGTGEYGYLGIFSLYYTYLLSYLVSNYKSDNFYIKKLIINRLNLLHKQKAFINTH